MKLVRTRQASSLTRYLFKWGNPQTAAISMHAWLCANSAFSSFWVLHCKKVNVMVPVLQFIKTYLMLFTYFSSSHASHFSALKSFDTTIYCGSSLQLSLSDWTSFSWITNLITQLLTTASSRADWHKWNDPAGALISAGCSSSKQQLHSYMVICGETYLCTYWPLCSSYKKCWYSIKWNFRKLYKNTTIKSAP